MNRKARAGGRNTRRRKGSAPGGRAGRTDPDAVDFDAVDWERTLPLELDPKLIEQIRARRTLQMITLDGRAIPGRAAPLAGAGCQHRAQQTRSHVKRVVLWFGPS